jgi:hypothetical protein
VFFLINTSLQRGDFGDTLIQLSRFNGLVVENGSPVLHTNLDTLLKQGVYEKQQPTA